MNRLCVWVGGEGVVLYPSEKCEILVNIASSVMGKRGGSTGEESGATVVDEPPVCLGGRSGGGPASV